MPTVNNIVNTIKVKQGTNFQLGQMLISSFAPGSKRRPQDLFLQVFEDPAQVTLSTTQINKLLGNPSTVNQIARYLGISFDKMTQRISDVIERIDRGFSSRAADERYYKTIQGLEVTDGTNDTDDIGPPPTRHSEKRVA